MERPALQRLLLDVEAGKVDAIVVYKVDRLSRSLLDFSRIMETLDRQGCSFVSVTQQFNTTHSMGRLTLNILLSFAQFEREIISERTRDKMSAARRKGKWVGGSVILGYDLDREARKLVINEDEAHQVREIFGLYQKHRSILGTVEELNQRGVPRKTWTAKSGKLAGGGPWTVSNPHAAPYKPPLPRESRLSGQDLRRGTKADPRHGNAGIGRRRCLIEILAKAASPSAPSSADCSKASSNAVPAAAQ
jgi:site-specific DNA recombinase